MGCVCKGSVVIVRLEGHGPEPYDNGSRDSYHKQMETSTPEPYDSGTKDSCHKWKRLHQNLMTAVRGIVAINGNGHHRTL